ncbi:hypothetical protein K438DRAFT_1964633 [Mycena galopus ATCC 62051]|nr:hypothetical protein K438DRAFT_1964633 [Mycena galopus ATCC 62051]
MHEILAIRLHQDYAVSEFLNAAYLDDNFPERDWDYWHLLGEDQPSSIYLHNISTPVEGSTTELPDILQNVEDNHSAEPIEDSDDGLGLEYLPEDTDRVGPSHHVPYEHLDGDGPVSLTLTLRDGRVVALSDLELRSTSEMFPGLFLVLTVLDPCAAPDQRLDDDGGSTVYRAALNLYYPPV